MFGFAIVLFIYGRVILDALFLADMFQPGLMSATRISEETMEKTLLALLIFLSGYSIGSISTCCLPVVLPYKKFDQSLFAIGRISFMVGILPAIYIQFLTFQEISAKGYLAIFTGDLEFEYPLYLRLLASFLRIGFILILVSCPPRNITLKYILLFFPFIILNLLTGIRGYYLSFLLVLLWYWFVYRSFSSVSLRKLIPVAVSLVLTSQFISALRDSRENLSVNSLPYFFYEQSTSFLSVAFGIDYLDKLEPLSYVNLFDVFHRHGDLIQDRIDSLVNPGAKALGHSLGGSVIQEHLLIGGSLGLFFFAIFLPIILSYGYRLLVRSRFGSAVLLIVLPNIIFSARARTFDFAYQNLVFLPLFFILFLVYGTLKSPSRESGDHASTGNGIILR
jgi:hypothetical protein